MHGAMVGGVARVKLGQAGRTKRDTMENATNGVLSCVFRPDDHET